jgi:predicted exporter
VLVFVFGSALIGVTSDYALHYLATGPQTGWAPAKERLKLVSRPLAVCALATSLGFASLALFGVSIFNQVAVFSVAGILTAWWFTVTLLPLMDWRPRKSQRPKLTAWWARVEAPFLAFRWKRWHSIAAGGLTAIILVAGLARFSVLDDVRQFQPRSPELAAEEARVREASGVDLSPSFLLSYGDSADQARQREEATLARWPGDAAQAALAVSRFDPSAQRRASNEALLRTQLFEPYLAARVEQLGLVDADPFAAGTPTPLPPTIARLQGVQGNTHYVVAPLGASAARAANRDTALGEGSRLVDPAARYSQAFTSFRNLAMGAVVLAFGVCVLIVLALYRTWRALIVLAAPAVGLAFAVLVPSAFGVPASFFSVSALFVVIGAGIDHSVFTFESEETHGQAKELAVFLAALTTILSMGLLAVSHTYPVASFGIAVCAGVTAAYLFSFVPLNSVGSGKHGNK